MKLQDLAGLGIVFLIVAIVLGVGSTVLSGVEETQCSGLADSCVSTTLANSSFVWNATTERCMCVNDSNAGQVLFESTGTYAVNATEGGLLGLDELAGWQQTLAIIVVAAVVIGTVALFYRRKEF